MAAPRRVDRLQSFIFREISSIFQKGLNDPRIGLVNVTRVKLSTDLQFCTIYVFLGGSETEQRTTFRGLESATSTVQYRLASILQIRTCPKIRFEIDTHREKSLEMDEIFKKIAEKRSENPAEKDL
jgi:ribosome-binding factor A